MPINSTPDRSNRYITQPPIAKRSNSAEDKKLPAKKRPKSSGFSDRNYEKAQHAGKVLANHISTNDRITNNDLNEAKKLDSINLDIFFGRPPTPVTLSLQEPQGQPEELGS